MIRGGDGDGDGDEKTLDSRSRHATATSRPWSGSSAGIATSSRGSWPGGWSPSCVGGSTPPTSFRRPKSRPWTPARLRGPAADAVPRLALPHGVPAALRSRATCPGRPPRRRPGTRAGVRGRCGGPREPADGGGRPDPQRASRREGAVQSTDVPPQSPLRPRPATLHLRVFEGCRTRRSATAWQSSRPRRGSVMAGSLCGFVRSSSPRD